MWYKRIKYPDGQISAQWTDTSTICVKERINSYEDLIFVRSIGEMLKYKNEKRWLFIPCLFGQRSDRRFAENQSFDLKIICDIINDAKFGIVEIFDPHSDVCMALIEHSVKKGPDVYIEEALKDIRVSRTNWPQEEVVLVSPDAGAFKKVYALGEKLRAPVMGANKYRDAQGNVSLTFAGAVTGKVCLIVDDLLDGGYTFHLLGTKLKNLGAKAVYLYVSHAYFNQGYSLLQQSIDGVYCTNSVKDIGDVYIDGAGNSVDLKGWIVQYKII